MSFQKKIILLFSVLILIFISAMGIYKVIEARYVGLFLQEEKATQQRTFESLLTLKKRPMQAVTLDYTFWDEMVTFVDGLAPEWGPENLDVSLPTYQVNAFWAYNLEPGLVYSVNDFEAETNELPIPKEAIQKLLAPGKFCSFFVKVPQGLLEISGATVHPSADRERVLPSHGYFFVGRLWNEGFIKDLLELSKATNIEIVYSRESSQKQSAPDIEVSKIIKTWDNQVLGEVKAYFKSDTLKSMTEATHQFFALFTVFSVISFGLIFLFLVRWVSIPLKSISLALKEENTRYIERLKNYSTELVNIAQLIKNFFSQKKELVNEITERKIAEENLKQANQNLQSAQMQLIHSEKLASIGQLAAGMAHEINNPLGFIKNNIEVLRQYVGNYLQVMEMADKLKDTTIQGDLEKTKPLAEEMAQFEKKINMAYIKNDINGLLEHSHKGMERIRKIVMDLHTFSLSNIETTKLIKVEEIIDSILDIVRHELEYKAELKKDYGATSLINGNPRELGQVFINMLTNASQAIEAKGTIEIKTYQQEQYVCVDISDTGKGISEENLRKIFDPFFTTKPIGQGTGLGLSVSYEIVKKLSGDIKVRSKVGGGTTFTVMLPLSQNPAAV